MRVMTFRVHEAPAAFSRATAVGSMAKQRKGGRGGFMPENIQIWRQAIRIEYMHAVRTVPGFAGLPQLGEYLGEVVMVAEVYGGMGDVLNVGKEIEDALEGVAYFNDRQITDCRILAPHRKLTPKGTIARNVETEKPGAQITLTFRELD